MGLSSSKHNAPSSSSSSGAAIVRRSRSRRSRILKSSCLRSHRSDDDNDDPQVSHSPSERNGKSKTVSDECYSTNKADQSDEINCINSGINLHDWAESSSRLNQANSLGSVQSSRSFTISNEQEESVGPSGGRNVNTRGCDFFPACFTNRSPRTRDDPDLSNNFQHTQELNSGHNVAMNNRNVERNVRFSRTLSVGRLRDRVLRRTHAADLDLYRFQEDSEVRHTRQINGHGETGTTSMNNFSEPVSSDNVSSGFADPFNGSQDHVYETPRARETRYRDLLMHRSNFFERRRRIRSEVRQLQRLGNRFENLSGPERACILSGQHRGGHCTCRRGAREANSNNDPNARASISRIVMLAEALFEVLDEIHQQSVVLSPPPTLSSIGSVPAPNEAVDSLPLKIFSKLKKRQNDDTAQCYICLVEYDDGDSIRKLPCHHEFHRACVDKWLKETHRVCPLCRGDICQPDSLTAQC